MHSHADPTFRPWPMYWEKPYPAWEVGVYAFPTLSGLIRPVALLDFLSIMSAAFDSFFGYLFWACAWFELNRGNYFSTSRQKVFFGINVVIFGLGLLMLGPGLWTSVEGK